MVDGFRRSVLPLLGDDPFDPEQDLPGALHDVSNELTVVIGWLERALGQIPAETEGRQAVDIAFQRALRGRSIARHAIGASSPASVRRPVRLDEMLEIAATGVAPQSTAAAVTITADVPLELKFALVEQAPIVLQILTNLLLNAIAFSPPKGTVRTLVEQHGSDLLFRVRDEGPGLSEAQRSRLFVEASSTRKGGAGVGLKHAQSLAIHHGGTLDTEAASSGACFVLRWPYGNKSAMTPTPTTDRSGTLQGQRILIIEDDVAVTALLQTTLEAKGADVWCVQTATELLQLPQTPPFTAALVDLSPLGDNIDAHLAALHATYPGLRMVVTSGSAYFSGSENTWGAFCWIRKPFEVREIIEALTRSG